MHEQTVDRPKQKRLLLILGIAAAVIATAVLFTFVINRFTFRIQIQGDAVVTLNHGTPYQDPGAQPQIVGTILFSNGLKPNTVVSSEGTVDTDKLGTYYITYTSEFCGVKSSNYRTVHVVDTIPPEITLVSDPEHVTYEGETYQEEGFTAFDTYDGDISHLVKREEVDGNILYTVEDSSGNQTQIMRQVEYRERIYPDLTLLGELEYTIYAGSGYQEPGYIATQFAEGDLNDRVEISGEVDPYFPGTYVLEYSVSNDLGGTTVLSRTVNVIARPVPGTAYPEGKVIYLTFDDGPSAYTEKLLDILAKYDVKATFFVTDQKYYDTMKRIVDEGHAIGIHSVTHSYKEIYSSVDAYFQDLYAMQEIIYEETGYKTNLLRFPGGSSNTVSRNYCRGIMSKLTEAVRYAGFQYFDWNVTSGDAGEVNTTDEVVENVCAGVSGLKYAVVLQHDIKGFSVAAVERIILWGLKNGYTFLPLEPSSPACHHKVNN